MTTSTWPPLRKALKLHETLVSVVTAAVTTAGFMMACYGYVSKVATDAEVAAAVAMHDHGSAEASATPGVAHPDIVSRVLAAEANTRICGAQHAEIVALWARLTRITAAEREPDRRVHADIASYYEDEFHRLESSGMQPSKAYLEALRGPWYNRPRR